MHSCDAVWIHVAHHPLEDLVACVVELCVGAELGRLGLPVVGVGRDSATADVDCFPLPWSC